MHLHGILDKRFKYFGCVITNMVKSEGKKFKNGLLIGRFQPFHKGHLAAARFCLRRCRHLTIGIGSANIILADKNPFPAKARVRIIKAALKGEGIAVEKIRFIDLPDLNDNEFWFNYIIKRTPDVDVVFSRHWLVKKIFREHGIAVISPPWHLRKRISATRIRRMIVAEKDWKGLVPKGAVKQIEIESKRYL